MHVKKNEKKQETVCVTGGNGSLGQSLVKQLLTEGYYVKALFRNRNKTAKYWKEKGCEIIIGDLDNENALHALTKNTTKVFHIAGIMTKDSYSRSHHINVDRTVALYTIAARNKCQVFVFISSISVYCGTKADKNVFTEETPPQNIEKLNYYSRTKLEMELLLPQLSKKYNLPYIIIRPTNIYGPYSKPWVDNIIVACKKFPFSFGDIAIDMIYVDDVAKSLIQAAKTEKAYNQIFNIGHTMIKLSTYMERLCGLYGMKTYRVSAYIDKLMRILIDRVQIIRSGVIPSFTFSKERLYPYTKAARFFNYHPEISTKDGLLKTVFWLHSSYQEKVFSPNERLLYRLKMFHSLEKRFVKKEQDIIDAMKEAKDLEIEIRAFGAMGSKNTNFQTGGISLDLSSYNKVLHIGKNLVTVQAGITMRDLISVLNRHKLALQTIGEWNEQTISGALSTSTHGGSIHQGTLASSVQTVTLITPDGTVREYKKNNKQSKRQ